MDNFIAQTAKDYDIPQHIIKKYYKRLGNSTKFHEALEDYIKNRKKIVQVIKHNRGGKRDRAGRKFGSTTEHNKIQYATRLREDIVYLLRKQKNAARYIETAIDFYKKHIDNK